MEDTYAGKKRWGLVFYGVKYKLLAYYRLGSKNLTAASTLDALSQFISEHGVSRMIITDINGVLDAGKKWKRFLGRLLSEYNYLKQINTTKTQSNTQSRT